MGYILFMNRLPCMSVRCTYFLLTILSPLSAPARLLAARDVDEPKKINFRRLFFFSSSLSLGPFLFLGSTSCPVFLSSLIVLICQE